MARKKRETMLQRQRRLLNEQRARRAQRTEATNKASRTLPSRGNTSGNSNKARADRRGTAKRVAGEQQRVISRGMEQYVRRQNARDKADTAAKGTKGTKVQTGTRTRGGDITPSPKGRMTKTNSSTSTKSGNMVGRSAAARRTQAKAKQASAAQGTQGRGVRTGRTSDAKFQTVDVKATRVPYSKRDQAVDKQNEAAKGTKGTKVRTGQPGKNRASIPSKSSAKTQLGRSGSARRAYAAAKQVRAAKGTKSTGVRTGQPAGAANRMYGADRVGKAVGRAKAASALSKLGKAAGRVALPLSLVSEAKGLADSLGRGEGFARIPKLLKGKKGNRKTGQGGKSRPSNNKPTKPNSARSAKVNQIPPSEGIRNNPDYAIPPNPKTWKSKPKSSPKPKPSSSSGSKGSSSSSGSLRTTTRPTTRTPVRSKPMYDPFTKEGKGSSTKAKAAKKSGGVNPSAPYKYKGRKSDRLNKALSELKVRDYKKKKK